MKKVFLFILLPFYTMVFSQAASKVNNGQNTYATGQPRVILSCDTLPSGLFRLYPKAQLTWKWNQITDRSTTLSGYGITDGVPSNRTINGYNLTTDVTLSKADIGLSNVDNTSDANKPISTATQTALDGKFANPTGTTSEYLRGNGTTATFPTITNYTGGTGINISSGVISNTAPDQTVTLTAGNRISITGTYPNFTISYVEPTINIVSRSLNSNFTPSSTKQAFVTYSVTCSVTNPLLAGNSTANVFLEYSTNGGSSWLLPSQNGNSSGVGLAVAVAITNGQTVTVCGYIPANGLVRLRTTTSGTASVTYVTGQETY